MEQQETHCFPEGIVIMRQIFDGMIGEGAERQMAGNVFLSAFRAKSVSNIRIAAIEAVGVGSCGVFRHTKQYNSGWLALLKLGKKV